MTTTVLTDDLKSLIERDYDRIEAYVGHKVFKAYHNKYDFKEFVHRALSYLPEVALRYKPEKSSFITYASSRCFNRLQDELRDSWHIKRQGGLHRKRVDAIKDDIRKRQGYVTDDDVYEKIRENDDSEKSTEKTWKNVLKIGNMRSFSVPFNLLENAGLDFDARAIYDNEDRPLFCFLNWQPLSCNEDVDELEWKDLFSLVRQKAIILSRDVYLQEAEVYVSDLLVKVLDEYVVPKCFGGDFKNLKDIAKEVGISASYISRILTEFLRPIFAEVLDLKVNE